MNVHSITLYLILFLLPTASTAQEIGMETIDTNRVLSWFETYQGPYTGVYHFGISEIESDLTIIYSQNILTAQIKYFRFNEDASLFLPYFITLTNVKIDGATFSSDQYTGKFVRYKNRNDEIEYGLKINNPWTAGIKEGKYEIGLRYSTTPSFDGKYPKASKKIMYKRDLLKYSTNELRIMRNEIFARYGYIFKPGGNMETYFKQQKWYTPAHKEVEKWLTSIERKNIKLILEVESQMKK